TAVRTRVTGDHQARELHREACSIAGCTTVALVSGAPVIEKIGAIVTSRDPAIGQPREAGLAALSCAPDFAGMRAAHESAWERLWRRSGIEIARKEVAHPTAFHQFHLLQTISPHSADLDVGFPPHGWREGYEGQIFWDDVLVFPFLSARFPNLARALLLYRYRRLDEARRAARSCGCRCAMFPWRSASTGREVTPAFQLNLLSGRWMRDDTRRQRHVGAAIALNIWQYYLATGDRDFMREHGAEMLLEIARFWASIARFDPERGSYEIRGVIGPDEFHHAYPGAAAVGIDNNAYTNVMAAWTVCRALELLDHFAVGIRDELCRLLRIDATELALWDDVSRRLRVVFHGDGIISQFEGYQIVGGAFRLAARRAIRYGDGILPAAPSAGSGTE